MSKRGTWRLLLTAINLMLAGCVLWQGVAIASTVCADKDLSAALPSGCTKGDYVGGGSHCSTVTGGCYQCTRDNYYALGPRPPCPLIGTCQVDHDCVLHENTSCDTQSGQCQ